MLQLILTKRCILEERKAILDFEVVIIIQEIEMGRLEGKAAVITGGNSGIGLATAKRFVAEGAGIFITGRRQEELDQAVETIGSGARAVQGDVSRLDDLDRLFATVRAQSGRIDVLFASAGLGKLAPLGAIDDSVVRFDVRRQRQRNTVHGAKGAPTHGGRRVHHPHRLDRRRDGNACVQRLQCDQGCSPQFCSKLGIGPEGAGIRVNVLSPGATETPGLRGLVKAGEEDALLGRFATQLPLGRIGHPEETAAVALFLTSDESRGCYVLSCLIGAVMRDDACTQTVSL